jgi:hypothetical protein
LEISIQVSDPVFGKTEHEKASRTISISNLKEFRFSSAYVPAYRGESGSLVLFNGKPSIQQLKTGYCNVGNLENSLSIPVRVLESTVYNNEVAISGPQPKDQIAKPENPEPGEVFVYGDKSLGQNGVSVSFNCDYETSGITYVGFSAQHYGIVRLESKKL